MRWVSQTVLADGPAPVRDSYRLLYHGLYSPPHSDLPKGAPSPSALFARRLMHFCSAEVAAQVSTPVVSFHDVPPSSNFPYSPSSLPSHLATQEDVVDEIAEDLADGLDILLILERAYQRTLKAHVMMPSAQASTPSLPAPSTPEPLLTGSSTALLAVLDSAGSHVPTPEVSVVTDARAHDAVLRIAHLGDCMGMLVRGDDIAWRSEEMWWGVGPFSLSLLETDLATPLLSVQCSTAAGSSVQHTTGRSSSVHATRARRRHPHPRFRRAQ